MYTTNILNLGETVYTHTYVCIHMYTNLICIKIKIPNLKKNVEVCILKIRQKLLLSK